MPYFDRYNNFRVNGSMIPVNGIKIPVASSDKYVVYELGKTRLDIMSNMYYNNPYDGWLIMLANPDYGGLEFTIPDQSIIRVPFPYESAIGRYITAVNNYQSYYGKQ